MFGAVVLIPVLVMPVWSSGMVAFCFIVGSVVFGLLWAGFEAGRMYEIRKLRQKYREVSEWARDVAAYSEYLHAKECREELDGVVVAAVPGGK